MKVGDIVVYEGPDSLEEQLEQSYFYVFRFLSEFPQAAVITLNSANFGWSNMFTVSCLKVVGEVVPPLTEEQVLSIAEGGGSVPEELKEKLQDWLQPRKK